MSEANASSNHQDKPESVDSSSTSWSNPFPDIAEGTNSYDVASPSPDAVVESFGSDRKQTNHASSQGKSAQDILTASTEEPDPWGVDALELEDLQPGEAAVVIEPTAPIAPIPAKPSSTHVSTLAAWSETVDSQTNPPDLADLISLIQELNQCNGVLMDRVSQLEEALEHSQSALQAEVGRSQDYQPLAIQTPQDLPAAQEQITSLFNQLEFAHQTNQRQQILLETLTGQLESSQERVAHLEREAALIQQRYNEQSQLLLQSENTCRDLQARLQRQQRYTLQFKAALEKCLEVPAPQYESTPDSLMPVTDPFLPKARRIQPWSSDSQFSVGKFSWMRIDSDALDADELLGEDASDLQPDLSPELEAQIEDSIASLTNFSPPKTTRLKLPSFGLPLIQMPPGLTSDAMENDAVTPEAASQSASAAPASYDLQPKVAVDPDPILMQQLDAAVKPLADMLAEAMLSHQINAPSPAEFPPAAEVPERLDRSAPAECPVTDSATADELLESVMTDAEDALWQDLARLIDASTEDVVKASLSGDFAAFEAIDFEAIPTAHSDEGMEVRTSSKQERSAAGEPTSSPAAPPETERGLDIARQVRKLSASGPAAPMPAIVDPQPAPDLVEEEQGMIPALAAGSSWPSPVVYPLRPTKKRQSLAAVDLPTFPR